MNDIYMEIRDLPQIFEKQGEVGQLGFVFNLLKSVMGLGILTISYEIAQSGWFLLFFLVIVSLMTGYNAIKLNEFVEDMNVTDRYISYFDIANYVFGKKFEYLIKFVWFVELFFICVLMLNMSVTFLEEMIGVNHNVQIFLVMSFLYFFISFIKSYQKIQYVSVIGLISIVLLMISLFVQLGINGKNDKAPSLDTSLINWKNLPKSIGVSLFSFGGHVIFPEIFDSSKYKEFNKFGIFISWVVITIITLTFAVLGYAIYGDNISDEIVENIRESKYLKILLLILLIINVLFTLPLIISPITQKITNKRKRFIFQFGLLLCIGLLCFFWTSFINTMALVGGFFENLTSLILPPLFVLKHRNLDFLEKIVNIFILLFGILVIIFNIVALF